MYVAGPVLAGYELGPTNCRLKTFEKRVELEIIMLSEIRSKGQISHVLAHL
jgi:hypothetical protein